MGAPWPQRPANQLALFVTGHGLTIAVRLGGTDDRRVTFEHVEAAAAGDVPYSDGAVAGSREDLPAVAGQDALLVRMPNDPLNMLAMSAEGLLAGFGRDVSNAHGPVA